MKVSLLRYPKVSLTEAASEVYYEKGVLKNFAKFTGKHLSQSPFLIKLQV